MSECAGAAVESCGSGPDRRDGRGEAGRPSRGMSGATGSEERRSSRSPRENDREEGRYTSGSKGQRPGGRVEEEWATGEEDAGAEEEAMEDLERGREEART